MTAKLVAGGWMRTDHSQTGTDGASPDRVPTRTSPRRRTCSAGQPVTDTGYMSRKIRKFRTDKFDVKQTEVLTDATHVNGWFPDVYMNAMSQIFCLFHVSNLSVRNFWIFCSCIRGHSAGAGRSFSPGRRRAGPGGAATRDPSPPPDRPGRREGPLAARWPDRARFHRCNADRRQTPASGKRVRALGRWGGGRLRSRTERWPQSARAVRERRLGGATRHRCDAADTRMLRFVVSTDYRSSYWWRVMYIHTRI